LKCLKPDHNTISNFRRDNPKAIRKVFRATVQIAKHFDHECAEGVLRILSSLFLAIFDLIRSVSEVCDRIIFPGIKMSFKNRLSLKPL